VIQKHSVTINLTVLSKFIFTIFGTVVFRLSGDLLFYLQQ